MNQEMIFLLYNAQDEDVSVNEITSDFDREVKRLLEKGGVTE